MLFYLGWIQFYGDYYCRLTKGKETKDKIYEANEKVSGHLARMEWSIEGCLLYKLWAKRESRDNKSGHSTAKAKKGTEGNIPTQSLFTLK